eukprot:TRINITY_DN446_c0_g3_i2.p1 TRINITY_DN446_c0_g3~~TRINITY_DN446_c0_g3_i2.p1  ORF type:complete len:402 (-),score=146.71 TRINITY_DN446_c0_g3_i2:146-1351(-)
MNSLETYMELVRPLSNDVNRHINLIRLLDMRARDSNIVTVKKQSDIISLFNSHSSAILTSTAGLVSSSSSSSASSSSSSSSEGFLSSSHAQATVKSLQELRKAQRESYALSVEKLSVLDQARDMILAYADKLNEEIEKVKQEQPPPDSANVEDSLAQLDIVERREKKRTRKKKGTVSPSLSTSSMDDETGNLSGLGDDTGGVSDTEMAAAADLASSSSYSSVNQSFSSLPMSALSSFSSSSISSSSLASFSSITSSISQDEAPPSSDYNNQSVQMQMMQPNRTLNNMQQPSMNQQHNRVSFRSTAPNEMMSTSSISGGARNLSQPQPRHPTDEQLLSLQREKDSERDRLKEAQNQVRAEREQQQQTTEDEIASSAVNSGDSSSSSDSAANHNYSSNYSMPW